MRRWLAIVLLALLPFQFSWAAVAAYCGHESDARAQHLGHHEHRHAGQAGVALDSAPADAPVQAGVDLDCGHCHGTCASLPAPVGGMPPLTQASRPVSAVEGTMRTVAQSPPERPQWARLA